MDTHLPLANLTWADLEPQRYCHLAKAWFQYEEDDVSVSDEHSNKTDTWLYRELPFVLAWMPAEYNASSIPTETLFEWMQADANVSFTENIIRECPNEYCDAHGPRIDPDVLGAGVSLRLLALCCDFSSSKLTR